MSWLKGILAADLWAPFRRRSEREVGVLRAPLILGPGAFQPCLIRSRQTGFLLWVVMFFLISETFVNNSLWQRDTSLTGWSLSIFVSLPVKGRGIWGRRWRAASPVCCDAPFSQCLREEHCARVPGHRQAPGSPFWGALWLKYWGKRCAHLCSRFTLFLSLTGNNRFNQWIQPSTNHSL